MDNEIVQEVLDRLDSIGAAISEGAVAGFEVLVKQALINGIIYTFWGLIAAVLCIVFATAFYRGFTNFRDNKLGQDRARYGRYGWEDWFSTPTPWITGGGVLITVMTAPPVLTDGIRHLLNPEYYALKEILNTFGG